MQIMVCGYDASEGPEVILKEKSAKYVATLSKKISTKKNQVKYKIKKGPLNITISVTLTLRDSHLKRPRLLSNCAQLLFFHGPDEILLELFN